MDINDRTSSQAGQSAAVRRLPTGCGRRPDNGSSKRAASLVKIIVADVLTAALLLNIFALYYFLLPRDMGHDAKPLAGLQNSGADTGVGMFSGADTLTDTHASQSWTEKFAGKFTDGAVEQTKSSYRSANISVAVEKMHKDGVTYYVADIYLADLKHFKTAFAHGRFGSGIHDATDVIAQENSAVIAINGDYSGNNAGPVVRNGVLYRDEVFKDALVMYNDGSMEAFTAEEFDMDSLTDQKVWQVWTFGPMLLDNGQPMETFNSTLNPKNPRTAIGYYEPGHYCFVVADGRQPGYSDGLTLMEMSQMFYDMGCKAAFNLDGGQSSEMSFMGELVNQPYKGGRGTSDIVYISDH